MSTDNLRSFLAKLETDAELQDKLKAAADMDAATSIVKAAGFDIAKGDWLMHKRLIGPLWLWEPNWI
jgi:predicted ribosomally synthesized peptide with nif11-like leader